MEKKELIAMTDAQLAKAYKSQRDELLAFVQGAQVSSGICCCGDDMDRHPSPLYCGHNPVDMWEHSLLCYVEQFADFDKSLLAMPIVAPTDKAT